MSHVNETFRPRMIIWQLTPDETHAPAKQLTTRECLLIIESIARTSKPIVVLSGSGLMRRPDIYHIVEYGVALGLKMIVEVDVPDLTDEHIIQFAHFGPKVFRLLLNGAISEDGDTRFRQSTEYQLLEKRVQDLKKGGYEIHLGITATRPDVRQLAFNYDYAFRRAATGLYCHMKFEGINDPPAKQETPGEGFEEEHINEFIEAIARMKNFSPRNMYFSPQCVKYGLRKYEEQSEDGRNAGNGSIWSHWCLAGKTFAYINPVGMVQMCAGLPLECGDLRANGYNFKSIWEHSDVFEHYRGQLLSCTETRAHMREKQS